MASYRDVKVLVALKLLNPTGLTEIKDSEMSDLTGLKPQSLRATYRNLRSLHLIEHTPNGDSSEVGLTKIGRMTAHEAVQAMIAPKVVKDTTSI